MTIQNEAAVTEALYADGLTNTWPFEFLIEEANDITFYVIDVDGGISIIPPADFYIAPEFINNPEGGNVVYPQDTSRIADGNVVFLARNADFSQNLSLGGPQGGFNPQVMETSLDRLTRFSQELRRDTTRSLKVRFDDDDPGMVTPEPGRVVGWGDNGKLKNFINTAAEADEAADRAEAARQMAELARDEAEEARELARQWAENPEDSPVVPDGFSALHHAAKASEFAVAAEVAETGAIAARQAAEGFRDEAELAANAAMLLSRLYPDTTAALADTVDGDYFWIIGEDETVATLWQNVSAAAVDMELAIPSLAYYAARLVVDADPDIAFRFRDQFDFFYGGFLEDGSFAVAGGKSTLGYAGTTLEIGDAKGFTFGALGPVSDLNGLAWRTIDGPYTEIVDVHGFVVADLTNITSSSEGGGGEETGDVWKPGDTKPVFGPHLFGWGGERTRINVAQLLTNRAADSHLVTATILGATGEHDVSTSVLTVDTAKLGATATLQLRPSKWDGIASWHHPLSVRSVPYDIAPIFVRFLGLGDSIQNGRMTELLAAEFAARGHTLIGTGTLVGDGPGGEGTGLLDEGRGGWEIGDITNSVTEKTSFVGTGETVATVADYFALTFAQQVQVNTLSRPSTLDDPSEDVRNGRIVDFDFYYERFAPGAPGVPEGRGVLPATVYGIDFLTNDARDRPAGLIQELLFEDYSLMFRRIRAYDATAPIVVWLPGTPRDPTRDALWSTAYVRGIAGVMEAIKAANDPNIHLVSCWAMMTQDGIGYPVRVVTPDPITGARYTGYAANVHPYFGARQALVASVAPAIAWAASNIVL